MKGVLLNQDMGLNIRVVKNSEGLITSGLMLGNPMVQNVFLVLKMSQGDLKHDPLLGAGLTKFIRGKYTKSAIDSRIRLHLTRAGVDYEEYKQIINVRINGE